MNRKQYYSIDWETKEVLHEVCVFDKKFWFMDVLVSINERMVEENRKKRFYLIS